MEKDELLSILYKSNLEKVELSILVDGMEEGERIFCSELIDIIESGDVLTLCFDGESNLKEFKNLDNRGWRTKNPLKSGIYRCFIRYIHDDSSKYISEYDNCHYDVEYGWYWNRERIAIYQVLAWIEISLPGLSEENEKKLIKEFLIKEDSNE